MGNKQSVQVPKTVPNEKSTKIYVLKLQNGKYYVGKTSRKIETRYAEHQGGIGSVWTKKYPPISIEKIYYDCDPYDEDKYLKICMAKYGIDNCRGGSYTQLHLPESTINFLQAEINMSSDLCISCGKSGHFIRECPDKKPLKVVSDKTENVNLKLLNDIKFSKNVSDKTQNNKTSEDNIVYTNKSKVNNVICYKCGQPGHISSHCTAPDRIICCKCEQGGHVTAQCPTSDKITCYKCKQPGHISTHCPNPDKVICYKCKQSGHISTHCTTPYNPICYKCKQPGHISTHCPNI